MRFFFKKQQNPHPPPDNGGSVYGKTVQGEGLPNIEGNWQGVVKHRNYGSKNFSFSWNFPDGRQGGLDGSGLAQLELSAANSETKLDGTVKNDVYGKSDHVTPVNSAIQLWLRVS